MTNLEINQLLHERVMGLKWIETTPLCNCPSCSNPEYTSSWADYGRLLEVAKIQPWWKKFAYASPSSDWVRDTLLSPNNGSTAMAEFVKERGI